MNPKVRTEKDDEFCNQALEKLSSVYHLTVPKLTQSVEKEKKFRNDSGHYHT